MSEMKLNEAFVRQMEQLLPPDELNRFLTALDDPPTLALRVNPLRPAAMEASRAFISDPVPWAKCGYYLKADARPGASIAHDLGAFYLQEASAMIAAAALDAQPGEKILDLCAAPGGKTTQIACAMRGQGLLVSNEPVAARGRMLRENIERMGIINAVAVSAWPEQLAERWPNTFDAILVDAPCSGEGMFRRDPGARTEWKEDAPEGCARRQADILDAAARMLRPGGRLVYSTCTFNRTENEGSVEAFLERHPEFSAEDFVLPGAGASSGGMLRIWPHLQRGDGHFAARLRKDVAPERSRSAGRRARADARRQNTENLEPLLARLEAESCRIPEALRGGTLIRQADYIHMLPQGTPPLDGIRTLKPGLCLMKAGRSHVQPMPALARACGSDGLAWQATALRRVEIDEEAAQCLKQGERLRLENRDPGWTLCEFHGLPAGFVKALPAT